jgi:hypothetical protein
MMQLVQVSIGITVTVLVILALFSVFPTIVENFACPVINASEDSDVVQAWKNGCTTIQTQTTIVPILLSLAVIIAVLVILAKIMT